MCNSTFHRSSNPPSKPGQQNAVTFHVISSKTCRVPVFKLDTPQMCQRFGTCLRFSVSDDSSGNSRKAFESSENRTTHEMCRLVVQHLNLVLDRLAHPQIFWSVCKRNSGASDIISYDGSFEKCKGRVRRIVEVRVLKKNRISVLPDTPDGDLVSEAYTHT